MSKIPFLIRKFQCPKCMLNGSYKNPLLICSCHGGIYPAVWVEYKILRINICMSNKGENNEGNNKENK
jgi:hypothetical protein